MIPKIIHYCWFGRNPMTPLAERCIQSWRKYCPDYDIVLWNEDNICLADCPPYVQEAYSASKWAFVTDYVRLKVVYEYGGIYLDTDVEIIKNIDDLLMHEAFFAFEDEAYIATGLGYGAIKGKSILNELMTDYNNCHFLQGDNTYDLMSCPVRNLHIFLKHGLEQNNKMQILEEDILILPTEYLCPCDVKTGLVHLTPKTYSIHHYDASWCDEETLEGRKKWQRMNRIQYYKRTPFRFLRKLFGDNNYEKIRKKLKS